MLNLYLDDINVQGAQTWLLYAKLDIDETLITR